MNPDIIEILDSYTAEEIKAELARWQAALEHKEAWDRLGEKEKDQLFEVDVKR